MYVIAVYDVNSKKNNKILKLLREYLYHTQNSVFEGNISEGLYLELKERINAFTFAGKEQIIFYKIITEKAFKKDLICNNERMLYEIT